MKKTCFFHAIAALMFCSLVSPARAERTGAEEELFGEIPVVSVASMVPARADEAPGIVTVITREEIENSGARDLNDLLSFVPGFMPVREIHNLVSYGVRGVLAEEGKVLFMVDGVEMNEPLFGNPIFAGQYFTDNIERIEIIRGPGSALYGGFAELAVVNIITRGAERNGGKVSATYGRMQGADGRRIGSLGYGTRVGDVGLSFNGTAADGHLGGGSFTDVTGQVLPMKEYSGSNLWSANAALDYKGLSARYVGSSLKQEFAQRGEFDDAIPNAFDPVGNTPAHIGFDSHSGDIKYKYQASDDLSITPRATYSKFYSWKKTDGFVLDMTDGYNFYRDLPSSEFKTSLRADYRMGDSARLVVGGEYVRDTIRVYPPAGQPPDPSDYLYYWSFYPDSTGFEEDNHTFSGFGECNVRTPLANVTAGMRYDKHSLFGGAFAPRFAATKEMGKFHLKGLASGGYRVPGMSTIYWYTNNELKPEISRTYEVEAGYEPAPGTQLNVNVFNVSVRRPIVYDNGYSNDNPSVGSRGAEVECRWRTAWGYLNSSYSYYYAYLNKGEVYAALDAQGNPVKGATQGLPTHKASLNAHIKVAQGLSLNPGALYIGRRYSTNNISTGDPVNTAMPPAVIANLFVRQTFRDDRWDLGLGVFNITNRNYSMATAYQSDDADLAPALCREFVVKVGYSF